MPLSFSNIVSKAKNTGLSMGLNTLFPGLGSVASSVLQNKISPAPLSQPVQQKVATPTKPTVVPAKKVTVPAKPAYTPPAGTVNVGTAQNPILQGQQQTPAGGSMYIAPTTTPDKQSSTTKTSAETKQEQPNFGGILFDLLKKATEGNKATEDARANLTKFQTGMADKVAAIKSDDIPLEFQQGRAQVVQQAGAEKEKALELGVSNALQQQQQELGAYQTAAGLAQPIQVPYSNQVIDPQTGLPVGGGAAGGSLDQQVSTIAEKVKNGSMGYDAGVAALSGYGQGGMNALQKALGPNFNVQQSNATAAAQSAATLQTGTIGGELTKQAETVKTHMQTLDQAYKQLTAQFGIPLLNKGINAIAKQFGSGPLQSYNIALSNVRDELAKILGGGTSTDGTRATAAALLPDNMTPEQLQASIKTATTLMDAKINEYTKTPTFNPQQQGGSDQTSAGGYNFKLVNGKWVPA